MFNNNLIILIPFCGLYLSSHISQLTTNRISFLPMSKPSRDKIVNGHTCPYRHAHIQHEIICK